jgi:hypothetical protein
VARWPARRWFQQYLDQLGEPISFTLNLRQDVTLRFLIPLHVSSAQASHQTLDATQRQPELMDHGRQKLLSGSSVTGERLLVRLQESWHMVYLNNSM